MNITSSHGKTSTSPVLITAGEIARSHPRTFPGGATPSGYLPPSDSVTLGSSDRPSPRSPLMEGALGAIPFVGMVTNLLNFAEASDSKQLRPAILTMTGAVSNLYAMGFLSQSFAPRDMSGIMIGVGLLGASALAVGISRSTLNDSAEGPPG